MSRPMNRRGVAALLSVAVLACSPAAMAQSDELSMRELLQEVKQGRAQAREENRKREQQFLAEEAEQDRLIREQEQAIAALERRSAELEKRFNANEGAIRAPNRRRRRFAGAVAELHHQQPVRWPPGVSGCAHRQDER